MESLERLDVYVVSRELAVRLYRTTREESNRADRFLVDQIRRAACSIPANIAEAYALGTTAQLIRGLRIALGSALELRTHLWIAERVGAFGAARLQRDLRRVIAMLVGLLKQNGARVG